MWVLIGCLSAAITVAMGAMAAHFLEGWFETNSIEPEEIAKRLSTWETAAKYQMYHSLGLIALGLTKTIRNSLRSVAGLAMLVGILLFSGSLYSYVIWEEKMLMPIVPIGGVCLILSWLLFACGFFVRDREED
jgi:uncharacterized membrane protein YgdD (TMEM256/DUF423 family)